MVELTHEYLCDKISENILNSIHSGRSRWGQIFDSKHVVELSAGRDWPSPDFIHFDTKKNIKCAYEFKPPDEEKGEYVKGVGQAIAYRNYLDYSTLIIPIKPIGEEIKEIVKREKLKIGLILYEPSASIKELLSSLTLEIPIKLEKKRKLKQITTYPFWAYYRDASLEEIFLMLDYSNKLKDRSEPDIRDLVFNKLFKDMTAGKTKTLGGTRRTIRNTAKNRQNYQKNYTSLFNHLWLWHSTGRLSDIGSELHTVGESESWNSEAFRDRFAAHILVDGRHLRLINYIEEYQKLRRGASGFAQSKKEHLKAIETFLEEKGFIKRNPKRGKAKYEHPRTPLSDEIGLWDYFGLLQKDDRRHFKREVGFTFDYKEILRLITPIITTGSASQ